MRRWLVVFLAVAFGSALLGRAAWQLPSAEDSASMNGWFESVDSVGPLTF